ncbi:beta strand repeat-containing protein, partial [Fusobacterium sp. PH5-29]|uniref:beta strand repeat-containing protein n=1 Tax=Fusobacterium sp. PH5-29 TaxID=1742400 RepID=UPI003D1E3F6B
MTAPTVSINVTPPEVEPTLAAPPVVPDAPTGLNLSVTPTGPGTFSAPSAPAAVSTPIAPAAATPNVMTPPNITYNAFGQTEYMAQAVGGSFGLWMNNNETITSNNAVINIIGTGGTSGSMTMSSGSIMTNVGSISTGTVYTQASSSTGGSFGPRTIISTTSKTGGLAMNVNVTGNYTINLNSSAPATYTFISLNTCWYGAGGIVELDGNVNLTNNSGANSGVLVGIRHQTNGRDVQSAGATTRIAAGNTMTLGGSYTIGALITTETSQETARTKFTNNGTIVVDGSRNIGIDFGVYDAFYPYVDVTAGTINISGSNNYGIRVQNMTGYTPYYGSYTSTNYYNYVTISNGTIQLTGNSSVGLDFAQQIGTSTNVIAPVTGMTVRVGGTGNVGIYRDKNYVTTQTGDLIVDSSTITSNGLSFLPNAVDGVLLRTDKFKSILKTSLNTNTGTSGNTVIQATNGSTGELASGVTLSTSGSGTKFTGLLASGSGSIVDNLGTINIIANNSSGIAALSSGTANTSGTIIINGASSAAVYNAAKANVGGTITATGDSASGIYNASGATSLNFNASLTANGKGATGIYNLATTGVSVTGGIITITGTNIGTATGIYNSGSMNASSLSAININNYGVGVYNAGTITVNASNINLTGQNASGIYAKNGSLTLNGSLLKATGNNSTALVYEAGNVSFGSVVLEASGTGATGLYNLGTTLTSTPTINIKNNGNTGLYNASGKTITATGNINAGASYIGVAGIYNVGTLINYSGGTIKIDGAKSAGVYNTGNILNISGTVAVNGGASGITVGLYNTASGTVTDVTGTIKAGDDATAIYNAGTMKVSGTVIASGTAQSTGIYNTGTGSLTLDSGIIINIAAGAANATGIYNDSSNALALNGGTITVSGNSSAGLYHASTAASGTFTMTGGAITTTGDS